MDNKIIPLSNIKKEKGDNKEDDLTNHEKLSDDIDRMIESITDHLKRLHDVINNDDVLLNMPEQDVTIIHNYILKGVEKILTKINDMYGNLISFIIDDVNDMTMDDIYSVYYVSGNNSKFLFTIKTDIRTIMNMLEDVYVDKNYKFNTADYYVGDGRVVIFKNDNNEYQSFLIYKGYMEE